MRFEEAVGEMIVGRKLTAESIEGLYWTIRSAGGDAKLFYEEAKDKFGCHSVCVSLKNVQDETWKIYEEDNWKLSDNYQKADKNVICGNINLFTKESVFKFIELVKGDIEKYKGEMDLGRENGFENMVVVEDINEILDKRSGFQ